MNSSKLESMPRVDRLLRHPDLALAVRTLGLERVTGLVRSALDEARREVLAGTRVAAPTDDEAAKDVVARARAVTGARARRVVNATGVILHTNLGRAPLSSAAAAALAEAARGYASIEIDVESGKRGRRGAFAEDALAALTGAEAALVVNNCAAAVLLVLAAIARGTDVVVSRGELVEIGGGFRVPEILAESGAHLVEVGTTNKTRAADYARAVASAEKKGPILRVHQGNFRMTGFVERPTVEELAAVARAAGVPLIEDLGGGAMIDLGPLGFPGEPTARSSIAAGADLVCFSTDKALGGPQGGAIVGRRDLVERARRAPLARAFRLGRLPLVALEATLDAYLRGDPGSVPTIALAARSSDELETIAHGWVERIGEGSRVVSTETEMGGGTLAGRTKRSAGVALSRNDLTAEAIAESLRRGDPPILARIEDGEVILDVRTVAPEDGDFVVAHARAVLGS